MESTNSSNNEEEVAVLRTGTVSLVSVLTSFFVTDNALKTAGNVKSATANAFAPSIVLEELIPEEATSRERDFFKVHEYLFKPSSRDKYDKSSGLVRALWKKLPPVLKGIFIGIFVIGILLFVIPLLYCIFTMLFKPKELIKCALLLSISGLFLFIWIMYV